MELVSGDDVVCSKVDGIRFFVYAAFFEKMGMRIPFSEFQRRIMRFLQVAPSQLTPNS